jgi:hypothetical protein
VCITAFLEKMMQFLSVTAVSCSRYQIIYGGNLANIPVAILTMPVFLVAVWCTSSDSHLTSLCTEIFPAWDVEYVWKWFWLKVGLI